MGKKTFRQRVYPHKRGGRARSGKNTAKRGSKKRTPTVPEVELKSRKRGEEEGVCSYFKQNDRTREKRKRKGGWGVRRGVILSREASIGGNLIQNDDEEKRNEVGRGQWE